MTTFRSKIDPLNVFHWSLEIYIFFRNQFLLQNWIVQFYPNSPIWTPTKRKTTIILHSLCRPFCPKGLTLIPFISNRNTSWMSSKPPNSHIDPPQRGGGCPLVGSSFPHWGARLENSFDQDGWLQSPRRDGVANRAGTEVSSGCSRVQGLTVVWR